MIVLCFRFKCFSRATRRVLENKDFIEISQYSWENTCVRVSFLKKLQLYWKETPKQVFFPWILQNFYENFFIQHLWGTAWVKKISMCFHWKQISVASSLELGFLNSILHWTGHTFVCILSLYSSYFVVVSLVKIKNRELPPRNILHIDSVLSGK